MNYSVLLKCFHLFPPPRALICTVCYSFAGVFFFTFCRFLFGSRIIIKSCFVAFQLTILVFHFPASDSSYYDHLSMPNWPTKKYKQGTFVCPQPLMRRAKKWMSGLRSNVVQSKSHIAMNWRSMNHFTRSGQKMLSSDMIPYTIHHTPHICIQTSKWTVSTGHTFITPHIQMSHIIVSRMPNSVSHIAAMQPYRYVLRHAHFQPHWTFTLTLT